MAYEPMLKQKYQCHDHKDSQLDDLDNFTICLFKIDEIWQEYTQILKMNKET